MNKLITLVIGIIFLLVAIAVVADSFILTSNRIKTSALVTTVEDYGPCGTKNPQIQPHMYKLYFQTQTNEATEYSSFITKACYKVPPYKQGDAATIYVSRKNSKDVTIKETSKALLLGGVFTFFGLIVFAASVRSKAE